VEVRVDKDKKQNSDLGNGKKLQNAEGNDITGIKTSIGPKDANKAVTSDNQGPASQDKSKAATRRSGE
jgi:hypothetical protein